MKPAGAASRAAALEGPALAGLGALQSLAYAGGGVWWLPLAAMALLVWRLDASRGAAHAAWLGGCYAFGWIGAGVWWLFVSLHRYGHLPAWMAVLAVASLAAFLSLYLAAAAAAYRGGRRGRALDVVAFAGCWTLAEWARGALFTGFPWLASGYSQVDGPLAALAPWVGVYGIGTAMAVIAAGIARAAAGGAGRGLAATAAMAALLALLGATGPGDHTQAGRELGVTLLQPNVPQDQKFADQRMQQTLQWVNRRLLASDADLVVAPETALPLLPADLEAIAPGLWQGLRQHFAAGTRAALIGVPLGDLERGYTNSVVGLSAAGAYRYDKHHLVPFGEFIPWGFRWFTEMMRIPLGDFSRGAIAQPSMVVLGERAAPNICYEDLFGEELARRFADAAQAPTLFVNVSNIGWFGDTVAVDQHLVISRLRALEFQRPMLRATNTGATAAIDHRGRVLARLEPFTEGTLDTRVQGRRGTTPYAAWASRAGHAPLAGLALLAAAAAMAPRRRHGAN